MTAAQMGAVQTAIYTRLTAGLATAGPGGTAIPVFDHVPDNPAVAHCRLEGFALDADPTKNTAPCWHRWTVRAFDGDGSGGTSARGQMQIKAIIGAVIAALDGWRPFAGGAAVRHVSTTIPPSETGSGWEAAARFEVHI